MAISKQQIVPHRVTKPIQLLAAWLVGLCVINATFLATVKMADLSVWLEAVLVIASVANVPVFIASMFLLQTKFRPELQEDSFYSEYLSQKTNRVVRIPASELPDIRLKSIEGQIRDLGDQLKLQTSHDETHSLVEERKSKYKIALNDHLADYHEIRKELASGDYVVTDIFGKVYGSPPPTKSVISFDEHVDVQIIMDILKRLSRFSFDGFSLSNFAAEPEPDPADVYVGSYDCSGYATFTENLTRLFELPAQLADLRHYIKTNRVIDKKKTQK